MESNHKSYEEEKLERKTRTKPSVITTETCGDLNKEELEEKIKGASTPLFLGNDIFIYKDVDIEVLNNFEKYVQVNYGKEVLGYILYNTTDDEQILKTFSNKILKKTNIPYIKRRQILKTIGV